MIPCITFISNTYSTYSPILTLQTNKNTQKLTFVLTTLYKYPKLIGFAEYRFTIPKAGIYYLYIQTIAKNLRDNSLWVSPAFDDHGALLHYGGSSKTFYTCPKSGPLSLFGTLPVIQ